MIFKIDTNHADKRLDKFIKEHFPQYSRAFLQKAIGAGQVLVNGKQVAVHCFLKIGDEVKIEIKEPKEIVIETNPNVKFEIVVATDDFLIINKPAGLVVHQAEGHKEPDTLVNGLLSRYPEIAKVGNPPAGGLRPGIVHRLDKEASGVMVVARTQTMFDHLKSQFKLRQTKKEYLALVYGQVSPLQGTIEFSIERKGSKMVARAKGAEGKEAMTEYEVVGGKKLTMLRLTTHTGRTHQIRVHLFAVNHPVVGDNLYKPKSSTYNFAILQFHRLMLHAQKLGFYDLTKKWREFEAPLPQEFKFM